MNILFIQNPETGLQGFYKNLKEGNKKVTGYSNTPLDADHFHAVESIYKAAELRSDGLEVVILTLF